MKPRRIALLSAWPLNASSSCPRKRRAVAATIGARTCFPANRRLERSRFRHLFTETEQLLSAVELSQLLTPPTTRRSPRPPCRVLPSAAEHAPIPGRRPPPPTCQPCAAPRASPRAPGTGRAMELSLHRYNRDSTSCRHCSPGRYRRRRRPLPSPTHSPPSPPKRCSDRRYNMRPRGPRVTMAFSIPCGSSASRELCWTFSPPRSGRQGCVDPTGTR
jgi:hypothetical protein